MDVLVSWIKEYGLIASAALFVAILAVSPYVFRWAKLRGGQW